MSPRVLHVLESKQPSAGSVAICLPDLIEALRTAGFDGVASDNSNEVSAQIPSSQLVHIHGWNYSLALQAAREAKKSRTSYIISPLGALTPGPANRGGFFERLRRRFTDLPLVRSAAALTALNELDRRWLQEAKAHSNVVLLLYGHRFQDPASSSTRNGERPKTVMVLGPLDPALGCVVALKAFAELGSAADGWTITLAGNDTGHWREKLEAAVRRKGGENRVAFVETGVTRNHQSFLENAGILAAPSLHVSLAVSIMQALDAGVPVVATRLAAPPGLNGSLFECGATRAEFRHALQSAMQMSPAPRNEKTAAARETARSLFDWSVLAPKYAELYRVSVKN